MRESPLCVIMWNLDPCLVMRTDVSLSPPSRQFNQSLNLGHSEAFTMKWVGEII